MAEINRATITVLYDGVDISEDISSYVLSFAYTDHEGGKSDDLQIRLEDTQGFWAGSWYPSKGAMVQAWISDTFSGEEKTLSCGTFAIDELSCDGLPDTFTIKAVSSLTATSMKREKRSRAWENISFKTLAGQVAKEHGLAFYYQVDQVIDYDRVDQRQESDLAFLNRLCRDHDLNLKVSGQMLIIYESQSLEQAPAVFSIVRGQTRVGRYSFVSQAHDIFKGCEVSYFDADEKQEKAYTFTPDPAPDVGQMLKINQRVESLSQAMALAKSRLRRENKQEIQMQMDVMGDTGMLAGLTGTISGWGMFDGKYIVTRAGHVSTRDQGYRTSIEARKVLDW